MLLTRACTCSVDILLSVLSCGPVLGAVYVQKVILQHLAGPIYLSPQVLHAISIPLQLFYAPRKAIQDLRQYYERLPPQTTYSPFVQSYKLLTGDIKNLEYVTLLSEDQTAVYLAKVDGREVLVKFALTYNARARRLLAGEGLAPKLIYDGTKRPRYGGLLMVVMDYVKGRTLSKFLDSSPSKGHLASVITLVTRAITRLHAKNLVSSDLQTPNILVEEVVYN